MTQPSLPVSSADVWSDENLLDPFPMYRELRDLGSVVYLERHDLYAVTRYDDVKCVLKHWELFSNAQGVSFNDEVNTTIGGSLIGSDPPQHGRYREILERPLGATDMRGVRERLRSMAAELVERLVERGTIEVVSELSSHLPVTLVAELVGLPPEGRERMLDWASGAFNALAPVGVARVAHGMTQLAGMAGYFEDPTLVERLRPGSWAARLDAAVQAGEISRKEFATLLQVNYILPALDTTIHATSNMIWLLAQREDVWAALRNNRALVPRAVHEALRLEGPVQAFSRVSVQEAEIGGSIVPAGKRLFVSFASAGRDERHYRNPETFDIERPSSDHLALGYGPHVCLGRNLATLEMSILLSELLERVERLSLVDATRQVHNSLRGFDDLRVALN